jgi:acyl-CoA hydrolase
MPNPHFASSGEARTNKIVAAEEAVRLIHDGDTVATGGFAGIGALPSGASLRSPPMGTPRA